MIQINYLAHSSSRLEFSKKSLSFLKKIKNKDKIKLLINYSNDVDIWQQLKSDFISDGINTEIVYTKSGDYMSKIKKFITSDCEYSCSMDDDIMINEYLWDYIIENIDILQDENNLFVAPLISNGIPSVEMFIRDFCSSEEKNYFYDLFKNTHIPNMWGANYTELNSLRYEDEWSPDTYYDMVSKLKHYYKGVHPIRISYEGQIKLAEIIINNKDKFFSKQEYDLEIVKRPYFCNSFYFIKTNVWKKIIEDASLFRDPFDEVPLNIYKDRYNLNMVFIKNGFCIHMAYNTIGQDKQKIIEELYDKI